MGQIRHALRVIIFWPGTDRSDHRGLDIDMVWLLDIVLFRLQQHLSFVILKGLTISSEAQAHRLYPDTVRPRQAESL